MTKVPVLSLVLCLDLMSQFRLISPHGSQDEEENLFRFQNSDPSNISSLEYFGTERQRVLNKYYSKSHKEVTDRVTIDYQTHTLAICRCWKSGKFPFCDNSHKIHNKFHKDNVGPFYIDGPTLPDEVLDRYTRPTPDRSITHPTEAEIPYDEILRNREKHVAEHTYSDDSGENSTRWDDKNDFVERLRKFPPGLGPQKAVFGWS